jgi:hypothetical protein
MERIIFIESTFFYEPYLTPETIVGSTVPGPKLEERGAVYEIDENTKITFLRERDYPSQKGKVEIINSENREKLRKLDLMAKRILNIIIDKPAYFCLMTWKVHTEIYRKLPDNFANFCRFETQIENDSLLIKAEHPFFSEDGIYVRANKNKYIIYGGYFNHAEIIKGVIEEEYLRVELESLEIEN